MLYFDPSFKQLASLLRHLDYNNNGQHIAIQVNISDINNRPFYIEITQEGKVNIMPYEYNDRDAKITASFDTLMKVITKQLKIQDAYRQRLLFIEGNIEKLKTLHGLFS